MKRRTASFSMTVLLGLALLSAVAHAQDLLPSWNDGTHIDKTKRTVWTWPHETGHIWK